MKPNIEDNGSETIAVTVGEKTMQTWVYANDEDRHEKMRQAWYWCDGFSAAKGAPLKKIGVSPCGAANVSLNHLQ